MTPSKLWKLLLFTFVVLIIITWVLNQLAILPYVMSALASVLLMAGLLFAAGAQFQQLDTEKVLKQQKRDEHERISRLMNDDMEDTDYEQEISTSTNHTRTRKPF